MGEVRIGKLGMFWGAQADLQPSDPPPGQGQGIRPGTWLLALTWPGEGRTASRKHTDPCCHSTTVITVVALLGPWTSQCALTEPHGNVYEESEGSGIFQALSTWRRQSQDLSSEWLYSKVHFLKFQTVKRWPSLSSLASVKFLGSGT